MDHTYNKMNSSFTRDNDEDSRRTRKKFSVQAQSSTQTRPCVCGSPNCNSYSCINPKEILKNTSTIIESFARASDIETIHEDSIVVDESDIKSVKSLVKSNYEEDFETNEQDENKEDDNLDIKSIPTGERKTVSISEEGPNFDIPDFSSGCLCSFKDSKNQLLNRYIKKYSETIRYTKNLQKLKYCDIFNAIPIKTECKCTNVQCEAPNRCACCDEQKTDRSKSSRTPAIERRIDKEPLDFIKQEAERFSNKSNQLTRLKDECIVIKCPMENERYQKPNEEQTSRYDQSYRDCDNIQCKRKQQFSTKQSPRSCCKPTMKGGRKDSSVTFHSEHYTCRQRQKDSQNTVRSNLYKYGKRISYSPRPVGVADISTETNSDSSSVSNSDDDYIDDDVDDINKCCKCGKKHTNKSCRLVLDLPCGKLDKEITDFENGIFELIRNQSGTSKNTGSKRLVGVKIVGIRRGSTGLCQSFDCLRKLENKSSTTKPTNSKCLNDKSKVMEMNLCKGKLSNSPYRKISKHSQKQSQQRYHRSCGSKCSKKDFGEFTRHSEQKQAKTNCECQGALCKCIDQTFEQFGSENPIKVGNSSQTQNQVGSQDSQYPLIQESQEIQKSQDIKKSQEIQESKVIKKSQEIQANQEIQESQEQVQGLQNQASQQDNELGHEACYSKQLDDQEMACICKLLNKELEISKFCFNRIADIASQQEQQRQQSLSRSSQKQQTYGQIQPQNLEYQQTHQMQQTSESQQDLQPQEQQQQQQEEETQQKEQPDQNQGWICPDFLNKEVDLVRSSITKQNEERQINCNDRCSKYSNKKLSDEPVKKKVCICSINSSDANLSNVCLKTLIQNKPKSKAEELKRQAEEVRSRQDRCLCPSTFQKSFELFMKQAMAEDFPRCSILPTIATTNTATSARSTSGANEYKTFQSVNQCTCTERQDFVSNQEVSCEPLLAENCTCTSAYDDNIPLFNDGDDKCNLCSFYEDCDLTSDNVQIHDCDDDEVAEKIYDQCLNSQLDYYERLKQLACLDNDDEDSLTDCTCGNICLESCRNACNQPCFADNKEWTRATGTSHDVRYIRFMPCHQRKPKLSLPVSKRCRGLKYSLKTGSHYKTFYPTTAIQVNSMELIDTNKIVSPVQSLAPVRQVTEEPPRKDTEKPLSYTKKSSLVAIDKMKKSSFVLFKNQPDTVDNSDSTNSEVEVDVLLNNSNTDRKGMIPPGSTTPASEAATPKSLRESKRVSMRYEFPLYKGDDSKNDSRISTTDSIEERIRMLRQNLEQRHELGSENSSNPSNRSQSIRSFKDNDFSVEEDNLVLEQRNKVTSGRLMKKA